MTEIRGRRRKQLLGNHQEMIVHRRLKEEALDHNLCRTCFGRDYGLVVCKKEDGRMKPEVAFI